MGVAAFFRMLARRGGAAPRERAAPGFKLTLTCAAAELTSLRRQVMRELRSRGLCACRIVSMPACANDRACLQIVLSGSALGPQACNELALSISKLPEIDRIHWGRAALRPH